MCVTLCSCGQDSDVCHFVLLDGQPLHEPVVQHGKLHYYCHLKTCLLIKEAATNGTCILGLVRVTLIASQWSKSSFSPSLISYGNNSRFLSIIIIIYPLTTRVIWAPQMILQPHFSIFPCSPLPSGTCWTQGLSIPWCLPTSSFVCLVFSPKPSCNPLWLTGLKAPTN